jgi:soluble lytic murein transglycosylase-like protein
MGKFMKRLLFVLIALAGCSEPVVLNIVADKQTLKNRGLEQTIELVASDHGIDANLIRAVMHVESSYCRNNLSNKGAIGCMQVTAPMAKTVCGIPDAQLLYNRKLNIDCGAQILALHYKQRGDLVLALREYNGGYRALSGKYKESEKYWKKVLTTYNQLKG